MGSKRPNSIIPVDISIPFRFDKKTLYLGTRVPILLTAEAQIQFWKSSVAHNKLLAYS